MTQLLRRLFRMLVAAGTMLAAIACGGETLDMGMPAYGVPPPLDHPAVQLTDFSL